MEPKMERQVWRIKKLACVGGCCLHPPNHLNITGVVQIVLVYCLCHEVILIYHAMQLFTLSLSFPHLSHLSSTFPPMSLCDVQLSKLKCVVNPYLTAFFRLFGEHMYTHTVNLHPKPFFKCTFLSHSMM